MTFPRDHPLLRIGELSRRLSVSGQVLRARENRYGLLHPVRSPGGLRLQPAVVLAGEAHRSSVTQLNEVLTAQVSARTRTGHRLRPHQAAARTAG